MSFTFKEFFENVCFYKLLNQAMYTMYTCELKICSDKCLSCHEKLLYLINILLNSEIW